MRQVIGFVDYQDFVEELIDVRERNAARIKVRVQDYSERSRKTGHLTGVVQINFVIDVAAVIGDDVLICRFKMGGGITSTTVNRSEPRIERLRENAAFAVKLLETDLEKNFYVHRGIVAAAKSADVDTSPGKLWHYEKVDGESRLLEGRPSGNKEDG